MRYQIKAYDYNNWEEWTKVYDCSCYLGSFITTVIHDYVGPIIDTSTKLGKYALNAGGYKVTEVYADGYGWSSRFYPSTSSPY